MPARVIFGFDSSGPLLVVFTADPNRTPDKATAQLKANASKLEQSSTRPAAVTARNPPDTKSWFRMIHLPVSMLA